MCLCILEKNWKPKAVAIKTMQYVEVSWFIFIKKESDFLKLSVSVLVILAYVNKM